MLFVECFGALHLFAALRAEFWVYGPAAQNEGTPLLPGKNIGPNLEAAKKRVKKKCQIVATYHTHVYFKGYTNERFSDFDLLDANKSKKYSYLLTVSGEILKLDISKITPNASNEEGMAQGVTKIGKVLLRGSPQADQTPSGD